MKTTAAAHQFLAGKRIAVTGVSRTPSNHSANAVYQRLRERGYTVYAVNPNADTVEGDHAYVCLSDIPDTLDGVVIGTRPEHALDTMDECISLGIKQVWMHRALGQGSVSKDAAGLGRAQGVLVIDGGCPCMFPPTDDPGHRVLRSLGRMTGTVPRAV